MGQRGEQSSDIEALVAELHREAADLRAELGPSSVPPLELGPQAADSSGGATPESHSLLLADLPATLDRLRSQADPRGGPLTSHRDRLGGLVLALKRGLIRLLTPIWDQQTTFDRGAVDLLGEMGEAITATVKRLELRLDALDRRLLGVQDALARMPAAADSGAPGFDYERFEEAFRGDPGLLRDSQRAYLRFFPDASCGPVLDLGCGDGTFLALLRDHGVEARGVDQSAGAIARCQTAGLDASQEDLLSALQDCADGSLGAVIAIQVVEHLSLPVLLRLLTLAKQKTRPGGLFLVETVNVASLIVLSRSWVIDPTHRQALHPLTLRFLVEQAGFSSAELLYSGDVEPEKRMELPAGGGTEARNAAILNEVVFAPQDYAVVARA